MAFNKTSSQSAMGQSANISNVEDLRSVQRVVEGLRPIVKIEAKKPYEADKTIHNPSIVSTFSISSTSASSSTDEKSNYIGHKRNRATVDSIASSTLTTSNTNASSLKSAISTDDHQSESSIDEKFLKTKKFSKPNYEYDADESIRKKLKNKGKLMYRIIYSIYFSQLFSHNSCKQAYGD